MHLPLHQKSGMMIGIAISVCISLTVFIALSIFLVSSVWTDIIHTTGGDIRGIIGWVFIYEIIPIIGACMVFSITAPILALLGFCVGWVLKKRTTRNECMKI